MPRLGRVDGGQLGIHLTPEQLQSIHLIRFDDRGNPLHCLRRIQHRQAAHVAYGTNHSIFVNRDGHAFATGLGSEGQVGLGSGDDVSVARRIHLRGTYQR